MNQQDLVKAGMAAAGHGAQFGPAQLQKLFFLIDREIAEKIDGSVFCFEPYDYGPFDKAVYETAALLQLSGAVQIDNTNRFRQYSLTDSGYEEGEALLQPLNEDVEGFIRNAANWVRKVSFQEMVSSIYKQYPDTKVNSIFR
jgi:uncharacterized protein